jgi:hypothetical protein
MQTEVVSASTQAPIDETTTSTTRRRPSTTTTIAEPVGLAVPLGEAVPGFTDTIAMIRWGGEQIDVLHWTPSQARPVTVASSDGGAWFFGLDASGRWVAEIEDGVLSVHPVPGSNGEGPWPDGFDRAIDVRVASAVWHDSDPGRLAWVKCSLDPRSTDGGPRRVATLHSLDLGAGAHEMPDTGATIDGGCVPGWGISPHLFRWSTEGIRFWSESDPEHEHLIRPDGSTVVVSDDTETVVSPDRWAIAIADSPWGESLLVSPDGTNHAIPGLAVGESIGGAVWSPDGSRLAYVAHPRNDAPVLIRIVEVASGTVDAEVTAPDHELWPATWSTDGRFLLLEQWPVEPIGDEGLMFYDVTTGTSLTVPRPPNVGDVRTLEPVATAEQSFPIEWWIADDSSSGTQMVHMIVEIWPLTPDQVEDVTGRLVWDGVVVDLCNVGIRESGDMFVHIGDIFRIDEGCGADPTAMQDAFDKYGTPDTGCLTVKAEGVEHEYCAPLN